MTTTSCIISFGSNAIAIKEDATFSTTSLSALGNLDDLQNNTTALKPFATYEPNFWLLDGNYKFAPTTEIHGGYISAAMSPANPASDFTVAPKITILFSELHSTEEITLRFSEFTGDWSDKISIGFFNGGTTLSAAFYTPTSAVFTLPISISNFNKIEIFFYSQNKAYRYARLNSISFDEEVIFSGAAVKSAKLIEQISPISTELPISTLDFRLFSNNGDFSITDPAGLYVNLKYKEPIEVRESIDNDVVYIGTFYLDKWESKSPNEAVFSAFDAIGLLDKIQFYIGTAYSALDSDTVVDRIETASGVVINLDASLANINVDSTYAGVFPVVSCRSALQNLLLAIGGYATCTKTKEINIKPFELASSLSSYDHEFTSTSKGINSSVSLRELITGVEVVSHDYEGQFEYAWSDLSDLVELFRGTVGTGPLKIIFDEPVNYIESGTASRTVTDVSQFYLSVNITVAGTYIVYRQTSYIESKKIKTISNGSLPAGTLSNIVKISDAFLIKSHNLDSVTQRVYDYYLQRYVEKTKFFGVVVSPGDSVLIDTQSSKQIKGIVEKVNTDLAGGFISDVEIVGVLL